VLRYSRPRSWLSHVVRRSRRETRDIVLRRGASDRKTIREDVALRFLRGKGIEVGALDFPLRLPRGARVRYVDYLDEAGLREAYSSTLRKGRPLVVPDIVDDGAHLSSVDAPRNRTTVEHLLRDQREGPQVSRRVHDEECARLIEGHRGENLTKRVREMEAGGLRPHFHVWEPITFAGFLAALEAPFSLELLQASTEEFLVVLRKQ
jgi:hypothetical protein